MKSLWKIVRNIHHPAKLDEIIINVGTPTNMYFNLLLSNNEIGGWYQNPNFCNRGGKILEPREGANNSKLYFVIFQLP